MPCSPMLVVRRIKRPDWPGTATLLLPTNTPLAYTEVGALAQSLHAKMRPQGNMAGLENGKDMVCLLTHRAMTYLWPRTSKDWAALLQQAQHCSAWYKSSGCLECVSTFRNNNKPRTILTVQGSVDAGPRCLASALVTAIADDGPAHAVLNRVLQNNEGGFTAGSGSCLGCNMVATRRLAGNSQWRKWSSQQSQGHQREQC